MAWTQADLDALSAAITTGVRKVTFADGRSTEYQTTGEMLELRKQMKAELAAAAAQVNPRVRTVIGRTRHCR